MMYRLLQKKRNFSEPNFPGDPGSLTLTCVMHILSNGSESNLQKTPLRYSQEHWQNEIHYKLHLSTLFPKETQLSMLCFF